MCRITPNPWVRKTVAIDCDDTYRAAQDGDEDAMALDDRMRVLNRGMIFVQARPGDNLWKLGLKELEQWYFDDEIEPSGELHTGFGHA